VSIPNSWAAETEPTAATPLSGGPAVLIEDVSVRYRLPREQIRSFKHHAIRWLKRQLVYESFWALRTVSLTVDRGDVFGVIGPNGAGKSTLLKLIASVLRPTEGRVRVYGRVAPLLDAAAGFDPELTGRENVFVYSAVLGHRRAETATRLASIVEFAGLEQFIDAPIRTYSSGMLARLSFSVATAVMPDILIVDEVLSVGDAEFQSRSTERIEQFRRSGGTIIMVSHDLDAVAGICNRAAWLEHGTLKAVGTATQVVAAYGSAWAR
jgi:ABC-2 type transport system ATP-binding protein/lipopolysaccharide transport system ATP-binding protein